MELHFLELKLKNFLSFGNVEQTIKLDSSPYTIITGMNKDKSSDDSGNRNGCGKTAIYQALHYSLYGKSIGNKVTLPTLVNNINKKNMSVTLTFKRDDVLYRIERGRNPTFLHLYKGEEEITDEALGDSRDTQDVIEELVGMDETLFCQTVLLSCNVPIFLDQTTANQKLIIENVLGVDIIAKKINKLKELIKEYKNNINNEEFKISTLKNQQETLRNNYQGQIDTLQKQSKEWENINKNDIESLEKEIQELSTIDFNKERKLHKVYKKYIEQLEKWQLEVREKNNIQLKIDNEQNEYAKIIKKIEEYNAIDIDGEIEIFNKNEKIRQEQDEYHKQMLEKQKLKNRYIELTSAIQTLSSECNKKKEEVIKYQQNICPTCGQVLNKDVAEKEIEKLNVEIQHYNNAIHKVDMEILEVNNNLSNYPEDGKMFNLLPTRYHSINEVYGISSIKESLMNQLKLLETSILSLQEQMSKYIIEQPNEPTEVSHFISEEDIYKEESKLEIKKNELEIAKKSSNPYINMIGKWEEKIKCIEEIDDNSLKVMLEEQKHNEMLLKLLNSPSSYIRQSILDKSLTYLNSRIKMYLDKLGSLHLVQFKNDMSVDISYMGTQFGYVSSGEMGRISIALTLAFRDAWENLSGVKINLLMLDEVLDRNGLDSSGIQMLADCLKEESNRNVFLVTHNDSIINSSKNKITIVKERSFSTIEL